MSSGRHDKIEIERIKEVLMMKILLKRDYEEKSVNNNLL